MIHPRFPTDPGIGRVMTISHMTWIPQSASADQSSKQSSTTSAHRKASRISTSNSITSQTNSHQLRPVPGRNRLAILAMKITIHARKLAAIQDQRRTLAALGFRQSGYLQVAWITADSEKAPSFHYMQAFEVPAGLKPALAGQSQEDKI